MEEKMGNTPLLVFIFFAMLLVMNVSKCETNISTDQTALLAFKARISSSDPHQLIATNWTTPHALPCSWVGIRCGSRHRRVTGIDLSSMNLRGVLSPELGNLSFLAHLNLSHNNFSGNLPRELANLRRLRSLDCSVNYFTGNLPGWLSLLPRLEYLNLKNNTFSGSLPSSLGNISNLEYINLSFNDLGGEVPREIGHLQILRLLSIQGNRFTGSIPPSFFNISTLQVLALSLNELSGSLPSDACNHHIPMSLQKLLLSNNQIEGEIPRSLSRCSNLQTMSLSNNKFGGQIPSTIGNLTKLEMLYLGGNFLTGAIPREIGNLNSMLRLAIESNQITGSIPAGIFENMTFLVDLYLRDNSLSGTLPSNTCQHSPWLENLHLMANHLYGNLPSMIHMCVQLRILSLSSNAFTGTLPYGVFNISTLDALDLSQNIGITGTLSPSFGYNLANLKMLGLGGMNLRGVIPDSISNCSNLNEIELCCNHFIGQIPQSLGNLRYLERFSVHSNKLHYEPSSEEPSIFDFFARFRYLNYLFIYENPFDSILTASIGNLSSALQRFDAGSCGLKGNIPTEIANLTNLVLMDISGNHLTGEIPRSLSSLHNLQKLRLDYNNLEGRLPDNLCKLQSLFYFALRYNRISGEIPGCLSNITSLRELYIDHNVFTSRIPPTFWGCKGLLDLDVSANSLNGSLSVEVVKLENIVNLDLSENRFSGTIPPTITSLQRLQVLDLADNQLEGSIPEYDEPSVDLEFLNLSHNKLTSVIPNSMEKLQNLKYLNVSFNNLSGEIPSRGCFQNLTSKSFMYNEGLCGGSPDFGVPACSSPHRLSRTRKVIVIVFILLGALASLSSVAFVLARCRQKIASPSEMATLSLPEPMRISYHELAWATAGFSQSNLLGSGSIGSVYRGVLNSGMVVAVKVFNRSEDAERGFEVECEVLRNLRHRNLTKVVTGCFGDNFKALVMEYMPKGSLEQWLYSEGKVLDVLQRLNIMIDVALALEYLHHGYVTPVIHCDLKPSNVLLDEEMVAHVCDFSVTKLLASEHETFIHTKTLATLGYMAPEYGSQGRVSTPCDVYSFSILIMETFSGRKPTDEMFSGDTSLSGWIRDALPQHTFRVIDSSLLSKSDRQLDKKLQCVSSLMELALHCAAECPQDRPNMKDVVAKLNKIKFMLS